MIFQQGQCFLDKLLKSCENGDSQIWGGFYFSLPTMKDDLSFNSDIEIQAATELFGRADPSRYFNLCWLNDVKKRKQWDWRHLNGRNKINLCV